MSEKDKQLIRKLRRKISHIQDRPVEGEARKVNLNTLAKTVALKEKGKKEISIAQVKEVMKVLFTELSHESDATIIGVINKYRRN